ncbi:superoxide dismutase family protein [Oceanihabitans sp. 2_MG-2023]|uniref:superoxide dismutase family protein n=1 Tax=Oceanihabitans sp. 2_MG-2023 TaxID=3062661 RepID=UPI0026E2EF39|nr:superoxide dismutase family protein [Oceanihabitans sp. 2_MG-2023]MDO6597091.1 superoxide dismutase family protein [Oceanihabitans sp. 2_MG-2023]
MKRSSIFILALSIIFAVSCKKEVKQETGTTEAMKAKKVKMKLEPKSDSKVKGNIAFTEEDGKIRMVAMVEGLEAGTHAIHIHEKADCSSADGTSSGGHWNPTAQPHGKWGDTAGYHKGDIGNLTANEDGRAFLEFSTNEWCIGCGDKNKDILGKAVIVHAGADDYGQPTGNAGGRISCGGIIE